MYNKVIMIGRLTAQPELVTTPTEKSRVLLTDLLDEGNLGAVVSFITTIVVSTLFIELCGAVLLYFSWEGKDIKIGRAHV